MIKTISSYLPKKDFEDLQKLIMWNTSFPFYLNKTIADKNESISSIHNPVLPVFRQGLGNYG